MTTIKGLNQSTDLTVALTYSLQRIRSKRVAKALRLVFEDGLNTSAAAKKANLSRQAVHNAYKHFVKRTRDRFQKQVFDFYHNLDRNIYCHPDFSIRLAHAVCPSMWHIEHGVFIKTFQKEVCFKFIDDVDQIKKSLLYTSVINVGHIDVDYIKDIVTLMNRKYDINHVYLTLHQGQMYLCCLRKCDINILKKILYCADGIIDIKSSYYGFYKSRVNRVNNSTLPMCMNEWTVMCYELASQNESGISLSTDSNGLAVIESTDGNGSSYRDLSKVESIIYTMFTGSVMKDIESSKICDYVIQAGMSGVSVRKALLVSPIVIKVSRGLYKLNKLGAVKDLEGDLDLL